MPAIEFFTVSLSAALMFRALPTRSFIIRLGERQFLMKKQIFHTLFFEVAIIRIKKRANLPAERFARS